MAKKISPIILKIAVPAPVSQLFDFLASENFSNDSYMTGSRVKIQFGRRLCVGFIHQISTQTDLDEKQLKPICSLLDDCSYLDKNIQDLILWAAGYYHYPIGEIYQQVVPQLLRNPDFQITRQFTWQLSNSDIKHNSPLFKRARRQSALIRLLSEYPRGLTSDEINQLEKIGWRTAMKQLAAKGYVEKK